MSDIELLVVTVYLIVVLLIIYRMINDFNDEFTLTFDKGTFTQQLTEKGLSDQVDVNFRFEKRYEFKKLTQLDISITNKSKEYALYVDWDSCALTDVDIAPDRRSRRVTRIPPGSTLDLFQNQVPSVIAPGQTLKERITAEEALKRKGESSPLEIDAPLINLTKPDAKKAPEVNKKRYAEFMDRKRDLEFFLDLLMRPVDVDSRYGIYPVHVQCKFIVKKLHWTAALPWNPKK